GAGRALAEAGKRVVILEASHRVGGRAWTAYPEALGHVAFDMGAIWFHDAENNPLTHIARAAGETLLRSDEIRTERTFVDGPGHRGGARCLSRRVVTLRSDDRYAAGAGRRCPPRRNRPPPARRSLGPHDRGMGRSGDLRRRC